MSLIKLRVEHVQWPRPAFALAGCLLLALAIPAWDGAGYTPRAQAVVIVLAGAALLAAAVLDERGVLADLRRGPIWLLIAFGLLSAISSAWTIGRPGDALRWGIVVLAYAALALAAAALARQRYGILTIAVLICGLALVEALIGLTAAASRQLPDAERIAGSWHPGGTFEYSSALALLQIAALPGFLLGMTRARRGISGAAAVGCVLAFGTLLLAESRIELLLAAAVAIVPLLWPQRSTGGPRMPTIGALIVGGAGGLLIRLVVGGYTGPTASAGGPRRVLETVAISLLGGLCWPAVRSLCHRMEFRSLGGRPRQAAVVVVSVVALAAASALVLAAGQAPAHGRDTAQYGGFLHGRGTTWRAAVDSFADRPIVGAGSEAFLPASFKYQGKTPTRYAHNLPLEAAAELGVLGGLLALALYVACGVAVWRARKISEAWLVSPPLLAFLVANLVDWEWHLPLSGAIWALDLGAVLLLSPPLSAQIPWKTKAARK